MDTLLTRIWKTMRRPLLLGACAALLLPASANAGCQLNSASSAVKHVVYVEFDNVHFTRDNPNVPSDLEQMPNLLNFIKDNGTMDTGDHAILISHTASDILSTQTGLYPDRDGIAVANSFGVFGPITAANVNGVYFPSSFFYWTDLVKDITPATLDGLPALLTEGSENVPAPWAPFTRAGCDVGAFSTANIVLERTPFDVVKVFGSPSPQASETNAHQTADFIGEAIHCAVGSPLCTPANGAVADLLPSEPGGYSGFEALIGAKYITQAFGAPLADLDGTVIADPVSHLVGFPGFSPTATQTLGAVATMLEHNVPVVFAYISDAHDDHGPSGNAFGPGQAGYVAQLAAYNKAFGQFFTRLKNDGIDQSNTLFVFTPDEGDHFAGGPPSPANCDGVTTPCTYSKIGEIDVNLNKLAIAAGDSTPFSLHSDDAPTIYVKGQPGPTDPAVRQLEKVIGGLTLTSVITGNTDQLTVALADPVEEKMLHMVTADPERTPTFTMFGDPDYFLANFGTATPVESPGFAWNHGDIQPEIARTFIGIAGPGVRNLGVTDSFFSDHTDVRPTIIWLAGLTDDYEHDGRVLTELIDPQALNHEQHAHHETLLRLGQIYKQINAPFGQLAQATLVVSTHALESTSVNDSTYTQLEAQIAAWTTQRDNLASQMKALLEGAEFGGQAISENQAKSLIAQAQSLIDEAASVAASL